MFYPLETTIIFNVTVFPLQGFCTLADHSAVLLSPHAMYFTSTPPFDCSCLFVIQKDCQCQKIGILAVRFCLLNVTGMLNLCNLKTVVTFSIAPVDMPM